MNVKTRIVCWEGLSPHKIISSASSSLRRGGKNSWRLHTVAEMIISHENQQFRWTIPKSWLAFPSEARWVTTFWNHALTSVGVVFEGLSDPKDGCTNSHWLFVDAKPYGITLVSICGTQNSEISTNVRDFSYSKKPCERQKDRSGVGMDWNTLLRITWKPWDVKQWEWRQWS